MNPDGHEIVVDWYRGVARTDHELRPPPEVWHEYVGHDINRDWFMMRQEETKHIARTLYEEWYPQIVLNHHQQSPFPTRIFIPPFSDPLNPHIHPLVVRGVNMVGEAMAKRFEELEMPGVVSGLTFTMWWNGGMRTAPYFHNMVGILTEVAHRYATPIYHEADEIPETIRAGSRELSMVEPSIWYANPWEGGWARLADAMEYHFVASMGTLDIGSRLREDWLFNIYRMGRSQIEAGEAGGQGVIEHGPARRQEHHMGGFFPDRFDRREDRLAVLHARPAAAGLERGVVGLRRREGVGLVLEAADCDARHALLPCFCKSLEEILACAHRFSLRPRSPPRCLRQQRRTRCFASSRTPTSTSSTRSGPRSTWRATMATWSTTRSSAPTRRAASSRRWWTSGR
jgi:hypothetical protein